MHVVCTTILQAAHFLLGADFGCRTEGGTETSGNSTLDIISGRPNDMFSMYGVPVPVPVIRQNPLPLTLEHPIHSKYTQVGAAPSKGCSSCLVGLDPTTPPGGSRSH